MSRMTIPTIPVEGGLQNYFREVWSFPVLTPEEERRCAERLRDHGDRDAAHRLVTSHLRLVCKIAMKFKGYGLPMADLISEGNIGLMKAVKKFEPERGFRLATYAMWWIKASITEYVLRSWSMVKLGTMAAQKKLFFSLRRVKRELEIADSGELGAEQARRLSEHYDVSTDDIVNMNRRLSYRDASLNATIGGDDGACEFQDVLADGRPSQEVVYGEREELEQRRAFLMRGLSQLDARERHIFEERHLSDIPKTLEQLGEYYGISRERVRQLEVRAMTKVKNTTLAAAEAALPVLPAPE